MLITADEGVRGGRRVPLKRNVDTALEACPLVHTVLVLRQTGVESVWNSARDVYWHELVAGQSDECPCEEMGAEDTLFILYTSGSTGKPKGVLHTTGGYMVYASLTHEWVFDYRDGEVYWCTADIGWITGHTYLVYGPLANGATTVVFAGVPNYPDYGRFWQVIDKHKVNIFYTAPTAIRASCVRGSIRSRERAANRYAFSGLSASPSIRRLGSGTMKRSESGAARSSIHGGRRKPAASS